MCEPAQQISEFKLNSINGLSEYAQNLREISGAWSKLIKPGMPTMGLPTKFKLNLNSVLFAYVWKLLNQSDAGKW